MAARLRTNIVLRQRTCRLLVWAAVPGTVGHERATLAVMTATKERVKEVGEFQAK